MVGILLNPLYLNSDINKVYNTNLENQVKKLEMKQIINLKNNKNNLEYLVQFDDLKFDNISTPISVNDTKTNILNPKSTISNEINTFLQRDIELQNQYSSITNSMNYNIVSDDDFIHNNMIPDANYRDFSGINNNTNRHRSIELFTGVFDDYIPKTEKNIYLIHPKI